MINARGSLFGELLVGGVNELYKTAHYLFESTKDLSFTHLLTQIVLI